jgi:hypothetical protein
MCKLASRSTLRVFLCGLSCLAVALPMLLAMGCSRKNTGRYDLSGAVSFKGQPVPTGSIIFAPDVSKGNSGPGSTAEIKDGVYRTLPGRGTIGGPHIATISGFDGKSYRKGGDEYPSGNKLFPMTEVRIDLPKEPAKYDFILPVQKR